MLAWLLIFLHLSQVSIFSGELQLDPDACAHHSETTSPEPLAHQPFPTASAPRLKRLPI